MKHSPHVGSTLDDFLREDGSRDAVQAIAAKRVLTFRLEQSMKRARLTKTEMARRMRTTRAQLDRLLDPDNPSTTLQTLVNAAGAVGTFHRSSGEVKLIRADRSGLPVRQARAKSAIDSLASRTSRVTVFTVPPRDVALEGCDKRLRRGEDIGEYLGCCQ